MERALEAFYRRTVRTGQLTVSYASGRVEIYGDGTGEPISVRYADSSTQTRVHLDPALSFGEAYMNGRFVIEQGSMYDYLALMKVNGFRRHFSWPTIAFSIYRHLESHYRIKLRGRVEKRHVAHHYDLDGKLFDLFLDDDWQYTCAYFEDWEMSLDEAQLAKKRHVTAKLLVEPEHKVLEMGCGWGGLGLYIAELTGAHVTGVTLSEEQVKIATKRAEARGLLQRTDFRLQNYRDVSGTFDRIISVGMLEHVGATNYGSMFKLAYELLDPTGVMVVHAIGRPKPLKYQSPFNDKYIFPGAHVPAISQIVPAIEKAGLLIRDLEILPLHYAKTCRIWRERFMANWDRAAELYDERFCRMWELYLAGSESAFQHDRLMIFQFQLARRQDIVPITRDYLAERKAQLHKLEKTRLTRDKVEPL